MDQLFTVDNMASQAILDATCGHLSLENLLRLEEVTTVAGMAVADHHYQPSVQLAFETPQLTARLTHPTTGEQLCGPVITRAAIDLSLGQHAFANLTADSKVPNEWHWMVATIAARGPNLKELDLNVDSIAAESACDLYQIMEVDFQAMNLYADSRLTGVTFSHCTQLKVSFFIQEADQHRLHLTPNLLKHFPSLECLVLEGDRLPIISALPAPQRLKILKIAIGDHENQDLPGVPVICNFSGLEQFNLSSSFPNVEPDEMISSETLNLLCSLTGVDWLASFQNHPPRNLRHIALPCLCPWTLSLLEASISLSAFSCRSLTLSHLGLDNAELESLTRGGPVDRFLRNLTHLKISSSYDTRKGRVSELLSLTPSLNELELNVYQNANNWRENPFDGNLQFRHLTKLALSASSYFKESTNSAVVTHDWLETVRRNASPAGLQVTVEFYDWRTGIEEVVDR